MNKQKKVKISKAELEQNPSQQNQDNKEWRVVMRLLDEMTKLKNIVTLVRRGYDTERLIKVRNIAAKEVKTQVTI